MSLEISEIRLVPVKPQGGLVGFASCVINRQFYLGEIAIHTDLLNGGFRVVFPTKKFSNGRQIPLFHPITREVGKSIQVAIASEWEKLTQGNDENVRTNERSQKQKTKAQ